MNKPTQEELIAELVAALKACLAYVRISPLTLDRAERAIAKAEGRDA